ncbi:MAG: serine/threonine-protein kinase [Acidobacteriota bacterium]|nr:MAG: serine/threonine-protein kinase [Acidobacteriota bacterium]
MIGQSIGHYEITAKLGQGGMGEVYRARDTRLNRDVALKILPEMFAQDEQRMGRFSREAQVLASLNHPNIAQIYGLETRDSGTGTVTKCLVMELVEGEDLSERIARGPIPLDEVLPIALQIAEALEAAHNKGIIHRDLKPANIKITSDGKVKILDFGLAKALEDPVSGLQSPASGLSQSPTLTMAATQAGIILGTAAYMSPEQAKGKPVDKRADIWAFGVVLWEMLTGKSLFTGETITDVIAAVVMRHPELEALPRETPVPIRRLLRRCLQKDQALRLPDCGSVRLELLDAREGEVPALDSRVAKITGGSAGSSKERWLWVGAAVAMGLVAAVLAFVHFSEVAPPKPAVGHFIVDPPEGWRFHSWGWPVPSPDGSQIAFRAVPEDTPWSSEQEDKVMTLWTRPLDSLSPRMLAGTEGVEHPFWSPDGQSLGFVSGGELRKINLSTGTVQRICALPAPLTFGADWRGDGTIIFAAGPRSLQPVSLFTVPAFGGDARHLSPPENSAQESIRGLPQFLQGEELIGFTSTVPGQKAGFYIASLDAPEQSQLLLEEFLRVRLADRHAFFVEGNTLIARPFDLKNVTLSGESVSVAPSVGAMPGNPGIAWFDVSPGGTLTFMDEGASGSGVQLTWVGRRGEVLGTLGDPGDYGQIMLSPDERHVAVEMRSADSGSDLWTVEVARGVALRVTSGSGNEGNPVWSPDGKSLYYDSTQDGKTDLRWKRLSSGEAGAVFFDSELNEYPESVTPDGRYLLLVARSDSAGKARQSIWKVSLEPGGEPEVVLEGGELDEPQVSPDGKWLAYLSQESGQQEVYVQPFSSEGEKLRVSIEGGGQPKWRSDGRELFFVSADGFLMSVLFRVREGRPEVDLPTRLFELPVFSATWWDDYAISSDGQRFLVKVPVTQGRLPRMHVITNWPSLLD